MRKTLRYALLVGMLLGALMPLRAGGFEPEPLDSLTVNQRREIRGLTSRTNNFVPKGQWIFGGSVSYSTHTNDDYDFLVVEDMNSEGYTVRVAPFVAYALRDNMALGARFIYSRTLLKVDGASVSMGDADTGVNLSVDGYYVLRHSYEGAVIWRNYIPLGRSKRFAIFTDIQLSAGGIQGKYAEGQPVRGTYETGYSVGLGVTPGLVAFATNNMAFEVSVGVMGINYSSVEQLHNQVSSGNRTTSNMSFRVNILSIGLGVAFYL
ncbi:MAG: hypothetical protein E7137_01225 [Rikenellaceae bacterium]|nr:hypothetical protein [Rikenellaceae bacterium]